jgi:hypothetical protein
LDRDRIVQLFCRKLNPPVQKTLYFENEGDLNRSGTGTAKPTDSAALKNWLFWFDLIRYGLQAPWQEAGRPHRRTTSHQLRLAQTDSTAIAGVRLSPY